MRERISELETVVEEANAAEREEDTVSKEREVSDCSFLAQSAISPLVGFFLLPVGPYLSPCANKYVFQRALEKQLDALTRELALMSSAWYELQSKLHSTNNVPTSRYRHGSAGLVDAQKSWLARQRSAVAGP